MIRIGYIGHYNYKKEPKGAMLVINSASTLAESGSWVGSLVPFLGQCSCCRDRRALACLPQRE